MEELFIAVSSTVTLDDIAKVLSQRWKLDEDRSVPYVDISPCSHAYVTEVPLDDRASEELFLDHPGELDELSGDIGDLRILSLHYGDPDLAREMARTIASSKPAETPMRIDADGNFLTPSRFLERLDEEPRWDWFAAQRR